MPPWSCHSQLPGHSAYFAHCQRWQCCRTQGRVPVWTAPWGLQGIESVVRIELESMENMETLKIWDIHTPLFSLGSRAAPHAFMLFRYVDGNQYIKSTWLLSVVLWAAKGKGPLENGSTHTKGSLTDTTKTAPAVLSSGWLIYPGICELEQAGPKWQIDKS